MRDLVVLSAELLGLEVRVFDEYVRIAVKQDDRWIWDVMPDQAEDLGHALIAFSRAARQRAERDRR